MLHYVINGTILGETVLNVKLVFWFPLWNFSILTIIRRDIVINVHKYLYRNPLWLSFFNETWILSTDFWKILKYQMSWTCVHWERNCSIRADRQDVANSRFFANLRTILKKKGGFGVSLENRYTDLGVKCFVGSPCATIEHTRIFKLWILFPNSMCFAWL